MINTFKNKNDFVSFIKEQLNIDIISDENQFNNKRNMLYAEISQKNQLSLFSLLRKNGVRYENHINNKFWIYIK